MPWTLYQSSDSGAPTLTGTAGSLIALLDAVLVGGYGAKAPAGWSKPFSGTNKAAYRNGVGALARKFVRIVDDGGTAASTKEGLIRGFHAMTDVDNGTTPVPADGASGLSQNSLVIRKSTTADGTTRAWLVAADDRTFILFIKSGDVADMNCGTYCGEFYSFRPADAHAFALIARPVENSTARAAENFGRVVGGPLGTAGNGWPDAANEVSVGHFLGQSQLGVASSLAFFLVPGGVHNGIASGSTALYSQVRDDDIGGPLPAPNPVDGALHVAPLLIASWSGAGYAIHGKLRGLIGLGHSAVAFADGDTFSGTGELAARTWRTVRRVYCQLNNAGTTYSASGNLYVETTLPEVST